MNQKESETLQEENNKLRQQLEDAHSLIDALRSGNVDVMVDASGILLPIVGAEMPYLAFFQMMNGGGLTCDMQGRIIHCNPFFAALIGSSIDALRGREFAEFVFEPQLSMLADLLTSKQKNNAELTLIGTDGHQIPILLSTTPISYDHEEFILLLITDVSQIRHTQERLKLFSEAVAQARESIMITDAHGIIEYVNQAFLDATEYQELEVIGQNPSLLNSGMQNERFYRKLWDTITTGNSWLGKMIDVKKSGKKFPVFLTISPIKGQDGKITHFIGIHQNLEEYEALQNQLHQAQKMEAIGTLVTGIAHDFNNTLAAVMGNVYLAKKEASALTKVVTRLNTIESLTYSSSNMIKQLLAFSRNGISTNTVIDVHSFLKEAIKLINVSLPKNIKLNLEISNTKLKISCDVSLLQQALLNLFNNAVYALRDTTDPTITVRLEGIVVDDMFINRHDNVEFVEYACLSVIDNGVGISQENLNHIFEPFFTTKDIISGTGLGLSMVYGVIQQLHGVIEVVSCPTQPTGTSIKLYIPLCESENDSLMQEIRDEVIMGHGETILVADDNPHVLEARSELLEHMNYKVLKARHGLEAIEKFAANSSAIKLLIFDVVIPNMGGAGSVCGDSEVCA